MPNPPSLPPRRRRTTDFPSNNPSSISYTIDGENIRIYFPINPWNILGLNPASFSYNDVKVSFRQLIANASHQNRAKFSLANHMLTSTARRYHHQRGTYSFTITTLDHFTVAACGDAQRLRDMINRDESLIEAVDEHGRTLMYLACKSGFPYVVEVLLEKGSEINEVQKDGSTPLHVAAYFGHTEVVDLLLQNGARTHIKNRWGHTALEESKTTEIRNMLQSSSTNPIFTLTHEMRENKLVSKSRVIRYQGKMIARELTRHPGVYDPETRAKLKSEIFPTWELTWHGTRYKNLASIMKQGLIPSGTAGITPPSGHFALGKQYMGIKNWAAAIFVSPSIWYAANSAYAEKVSSQGVEWCALVKAYCKPESYRRFTSTVLR